LPVNIILDELKHEDIRKRINSVKNIHIIASSLGPERTRTELIPFLTGNFLKIHS
jgi:serine/threonine-protein phosphatase 2A regulatory subunit A